MERFVSTFETLWQGLIQQYTAVYNETKVLEWKRFAALHGDEGIALQLAE
jgi:hypothetical protein